MRTMIITVIQAFYPIKVTDFFININYILKKITNNSIENNNIHCTYHIVAHIKWVCLTIFMCKFLYHMSQITMPYTVAVQRI